LPGPGRLSHLHSSMLVASELGNEWHVAFHLRIFGVSNMRKIVSAALLSAFVTAFALPVVAQTPAPKGPADCKANETWDAVTKTCKMN
jgi:hypothetical protein